MENLCAKQALERRFHFKKPTELQESEMKPKALDVWSSGFCPQHPISQIGWYTSMSALKRWKCRDQFRSPKSSSGT